MTRLLGWQKNFDALVKERRKLPFSWGSNDCCIWASDSVLALTGSDPAVDLRGSYDSALGATRILESHGGVSALANSKLGASVNPAYATIGDVVLINSSGRDALAVCGGQIIFAVSERGLECMAMSEAVLAWKI